MPLSTIPDEQALSLLEQHAQGLFAEALKVSWIKIFSARPQLKNFLTRSSALTLEQYGSSLFTAESKISTTLSAIISSKVAKLFGDTAGARATTSLTRLSNIDTSSHGGIFSEDTTVQSHLMIASGATTHQSTALVSLACGVVPMNNATWPRGFFRRGERESLLPKSYDRVAVHECGAFTKAHLAKRVNDSTLDSCTKRIYSIIEQVPHLFEQQYFFEQVSLINAALWQQGCTMSGVTDFYHILLEDITAALVIKSIEENDTLSQLIFCEKDRPQLLELFANLPGTWSLDKKKGTFLFWASTGDFRAASVWPSADGTQLITSKRSIPYTADAIKAALISKELVPSVFLSLVSLLSHGVRPSGGYHQIAYLPEYGARLESFAKDRQSVRCPRFLGQMQTADLFQLGYGFTFIKDALSRTGFAGIDALICEPLSREEYQRQLSTTTVAASLVHNTKRLFSEIVPKHQQ